MSVIGTFVRILFCILNLLGCFRLASLVELNVSDNNLKMLPPTIGYLKQLKTFLADNNILDFLPPEVSQPRLGVPVVFLFNISYVSPFLFPHPPLPFSPFPPLFTLPTPPIFFHF